MVPKGWTVHDPCSVCDSKAKVNSRKDEDQREQDCIETCVHSGKVWRREGENLASELN